MQRSTLLPLCLAVFPVISCGDSGGTTPHDESHEHAAEEHGHVHDAPNGGTLIELGDHFANLELVLNANKGELHAWIHDAHAQNAIRLPNRRIPVGVALSTGERFDLALEPVENVLTGEVAGDSSQFLARDPKLVKITDFEAFLPPLTIKGQTLGALRFRFPSGELVTTQ